jgi:plasmid stabilization system protein ParE
VKKYSISTSTGSAEQEIDDYFLYIKEDSEQNAINWYFNLKDKIQSLDTMPERCPLADENPAFPFEVRCLLVNNYRVLYRINGGVVEVLHVKHPRKDHVQE